MRRALRPLPLLALALASACEDGPTTAKPKDCATGELRLDVGQAALLAPGSGVEASCALASSGGAEYALAYVDTRAIEKSRTGPEGYGGVFPDYTITLDVNGGGPMTTAAPARGPTFSLTEAPHDEQITHVRSRAADDGDGDFEPWERATPWTVGEEFQLYDEFQGINRTARVMRIYDGHFVIAWYVGDAPETVNQVVALMDEAFPEVRERALPLLKDVFVPTLPRTSTGSGQYLLLLRTGGIQGASAWASTAVLGEDTVRNWLTFKLTTLTGADAVSMGTLMTHEIAHSFQRLYMHSTRAAGAPQPAAGAARWGVEGGANLISYEFLRRMAGVGFASNFDWKSPATGARDYYAFRAQPARGQFNDAYDNSMGFMRDLVLRRMERGEGVEEAIRQVSRGSIEGWFGFDHAGGRREGLTARMKDRLGGEWEPADAMLTWALSHAADDRTSSKVFQDRASLRVSEYDSPQQYGWHPDATAEGAATVTASRRYGSPGYLFLRDAGSGVQLAARSSTGTVRWMVVRTK